MTKENSPETPKNIRDTIRAIDEKYKRRGKQKSQEQQQKDIKDVKKVPSFEEYLTQVQEDSRDGFQITEYNKPLIEMLYDIKVKDAFPKGINQIIIFGVPGVGKTYIMENFFSRNKSDRHIYITNDREFRENLDNRNMRLKRIEEKTHSTESFPFEMLFRSDIVVYDDIGSVKIDSDYISKMTYWIEGRAKKGKKTIFTTNLKLENLKAIDLRLYSRMLEKTLGIVLEGPDMRQSSFSMVDIRA